MTRWINVMANITYYFNLKKLFHYHSEAVPILSLIFVKSLSDILFLIHITGSGFLE